MVFSSVYLKALVRIGNELGVEVTATKIQKIFFLLQEEGGKDVGLKFEPYIFGPYSKELDEVLDSLVDQGVIEEKAKPIKDVLTGFIIGYKRSYILKDDRDSHVEAEVEKFFEKWVVKDRKEILNYVYRKYPQWTRYSVIRDKVLRM
ncbi:conjugal transfer protein (plasmid) [Sulfolobus tengchongensis]|uniref:Conjugal transfer protein n=1 Tax=Sulfolobus tengchongensis TaxID=207809 RepID=A0AAX4L5I3_9CREN